MNQNGDHDEIRMLLRQFGWNTTCFQLVNPGIQHWFSEDRQAVVGYVRKAGVTMVAGAPVCALADLPAVVSAFERDLGPRVCYFGAEARMRDYAREAEGYSFASLGAQPVWSPRGWIERFEGDRMLRAQLHRARNKGVRVVEWSVAQAQQSPDLHRCLDQWLSHRGLPPLHFLVEPETLADLEGKRVFVGDRGGTPVGFTVLAPIPGRTGWLTEQFVRGDDAPNGTVELMIDTAVREIAVEGAEYLTMGIVPLSLRGRDEGLPSNPPWLRGLSNWVRAHGRRFYNFDGLDWFKEKFHPETWEPVYAISTEQPFRFRTLYAIAAAFTERSPILAVGAGLGRAMREEVRRLVTRP